MKLRVIGLLTVAATLVLSAVVSAQTPLGTAFTYQGQIKQSGSPFTGSCDFIFVLYNANPGGSQQGGILNPGAVAVSNGLFTVPLDFGAVFTGDKRWLDIQARCPAGSGTYATLSPRQELTVSPNTAYALKAGSAASSPWSGLTGVPAMVTNVTASAPLSSSGGTAPNISVTGILPVANGGTGSATQNFVDLSTAQGVGGVKTFASAPVFAAVGAPFSVSNTGLVANLNADMFDGQHSAFYQNAANITSGALSTDRFSAYADLIAESRIGAATGTVAAGDHLHDGNYYTQGMADARFVNTTGPDSIAGNSPNAIFTVTQAGAGPAASFSAGSNNGIYANSAAAVGSDYSGVRGDGGYIGVWGQASAASTYGVVGLNTGSGVAAYFRSASGTSLWVDGTTLMNNTLTVPKILYSSAKTEYYSITGEAFQPGFNAAYANSGGMGGAYMMSGVGMMTAPVHLPHGAVVTEFKAFFYDNSSSDLIFYLCRMPLPGGGYSHMASVTTSGTPGYSSLADASIAYNPIDNSSNGYLVYVYCDAWTDISLRIMGVSITYTISEPH
jgi:hypothetical protein